MDEEQITEHDARARERQQARLRTLRTSRRRDAWETVVGFVLGMCGLAVAIAGTIAALIVAALLPALPFAFLLWLAWFLFAR